MPVACYATVKQGVLQGEVRSTYDGKSYCSFEGIPYAKPPIGLLRFKDPQEPITWTGIRNATKPGNRCAQINPLSKRSFEGSEDCLYLNVYTPQLPSEKNQKLPVLFFVHGGRLLTGYGDYHQPDYFIRHNVILVTINYRLNILGFLCLNIPEAPGNAGLKDTVMALKWVKQNITNFNGDGENITAFGESAGAAIVTTYVMTRMAAGLCSRIIAQSGNCLSEQFLAKSEDDNIKKATNIALNLGFSPTDTQSLYLYLMELPVERLVYAFMVSELRKPAAKLMPYLTAVVEKKIQGIECYFDEHPLISLRENRFQRIPVLTGLSTHEAALFVKKNDDGTIVMEEDLQVFLPRYLPVNMNSVQGKTIIEGIKKFYFKDVNNASKSEYVDFLSDVFFHRDILYYVDLLSKFSEVYLYRFCYSGNLNTKIMKNLDLKGTTHGDIIQYQFYRIQKAKQCKEEDQKIVDFLTETWCNFARDGKPSCQSRNLEWPKYSNRNKQCLEIDREINIDKNMAWNTLEFWKKLGERSKL